MLGALSHLHRQLGVFPPDNMALDQLLTQVAYLARMRYRQHVNTTGFVSCRNRNFAWGHNISTWPVSTRKREMVLRASHVDSLTHF